MHRPLLGLADGQTSSNVTPVAGLADGQTSGDVGPVADLADGQTSGHVEPGSRSQSGGWPDDQRQRTQGWSQSSGRPDDQRRGGEPPWVPYGAGTGDCGDCGTGD